MANNDYVDDSDEIPENAHEMLFAEDLVRYVMQRDDDVYYPGDRFEPFGEHVYDGFNETTRQAVEFLLGIMELEHERLFNRMQSDNAVSSEMYMRLANDTRVKYFKDGFDADRFLNYCVHLSSLAVHFYTEGIEEAPVMAVSCIVEAVQNVDMKAGGWETLDRSARRYAAMSRDAMSRSSPETGSSDEVAPEADSDAGVPEANHLAAVADRHSVKSNSGADEESGATRNKPKFDEELVQNQLDRSKSDSEAQDHHRTENICVGNKKKEAAVASGSHESSSSPNASEINSFEGAGFEKESSADYKLNQRASRVISNEPRPGTSCVKKKLFADKFNPGPSSLANNENNRVKYCVGNKRGVNGRTSFDYRNINLYLKSGAKRKLDLSPAKMINPKIKKSISKN